MPSTENKLYVDNDKDKTNVKDLLSYKGKEKNKD